MCTFLACTRGLVDQPQRQAGCDRICHWKRESKQERRIQPCQGRSVQGCWLEHVSGSSECRRQASQAGHFSQAASSRWTVLLSDCPPPDERRQPWRKSPTFLSHGQPQQHIPPRRLLRQLFSAGRRRCWRNYHWWQPCALRQKQHVRELSAHYTWSHFSIPQQLPSRWQSRRSHCITKLIPGRRTPPWLRFGLAQRKTSKQ